MSTVKIDLKTLSGNTVQTTKGETVKIITGISRLNSLQWIAKTDEDFILEINSENISKI
jgi:hypothetical protein